MSEEKCPVDGILFGPDVGKKAKDRVDAIKSQAGSSSVFFSLGDSPRKGYLKGQGSHEKGPERYNPYYRKGGAKWSKPGQQSRPAPKK